MWWKYYVFICESRKMRPFETIPGIGRGEEKRQL
jgi:hypothetical protein